ncbi:MAG: hypothetical protein EOO27_35365 [Comamonadaceae bacterium]|nr:MAG: hypothetical protein EOO27_35365 [Comamonadaceae bacterium]
MARPVATRPSLASRLYEPLRLGPATALAAVVGNLILLGYFWQIGFMPQDLGALLGLGIVVSLGVLAAIMGALALITAAAMLPRLYELPTLTRNQTAAAWTVTGAPFVAWLLKLFWPHHAQALWLLAGLLVVLALVYLVRQLWSEPAWASQLASVASAVVGAFLGLAFLLLVLGELGRRQVSEGWFLVVLAFGILLLFTINVLLTHADDWGIGAGVLLVVGILMATGVLSYQGYVPERVATILGLRYDDPVALRIPQASCELLVSAVKPEEAAITEPVPAWACRPGSNAVTVRVDVRLGSRWLVRVLSVNGVKAEDAGVRLTLPDSGTELVLR